MELSGIDIAGIARCRQKGAAVRRHTMLHRALESHAANGKEPDTVLAQRMMATPERSALRHPFIFHRITANPKLLALRRPPTIPLRYPTSSCVRIARAQGPTRSLLFPTPNRDRHRLTAEPVPYTPASLSTCPVYDRFAFAISLGGPSVTISPRAKELVRICFRRPAAPPRDEQPPRLCGRAPGPTARRRSDHNVIRLRTGPTGRCLRGTEDWEDRSE